MKKLLAAASVLLALSSPAWSGTEKYGPDLDASFLLPGNAGSFEVPTGNTTWCGDDYCARWSDLAVVTGIGDVSVVNVLTWLEVHRWGDPVVDGVQFVDIWGAQTSTGLTGFDAANPAMVLQSEDFIGNSGTAYSTTITTSTLGNLASLLPGFDLSSISGDPNSIVYVAQTGAMLPPGEFDCPEPTALALLGTGLLGFGVIRRRRA